MANPPPHFIVFVPGYMGSQLRNQRTGERVWLDIPRLLRNPFDIPGALARLFEQMRYPNDDIVPDGILDEVLFLPPLFKQEQYGRLLEALERMGYDLSGRPAGDKPAVYTFAYDWRQDNRISARQLGQFIEQIEPRHPGEKAILIGHSNGGIVARWYIEKEGGKDHVARLFLMGSPWDGAPKAFQVLQDGLDVFLMRIFNRADNRLQDRIREAILSFPSFYQLIPAEHAFLHDPLGQAVDPFRPAHWLPTERQRQMLLEGRRFNQELGTNLSVETLCFFGVKNLTTTSGRVAITTQGLWGGFEWERTDEGDGTVPVVSAVHPQAQQKLPFVASHGDIYIVPPVLEKLEWELVTKYRVGVLAQADTPNLTIHFEPEHDAYDPGEPIRVWATVQQRPSGAPVYGAEIDVQIEFRQALPGFPEPYIEAPQLPIRLRESEQEAGRYTGELKAPFASGYYRLAATVNVPGEPSVPLEELLLVEGELPPEAVQTAGAEFSSFGVPTEAAEAAPPAPLTGGPVFVGGASAPPSKPVYRSWDEPSATPAAPPPDEPPLAEVPTGRYLAAEITEGAADQPLPFEQESTLAIFVDEATGPLRVRFQEDGLFAAEEQVVALEVLLSSPDFIVHTRLPQPLRVPRRGRSRNKARFDLEPRQSGSGRATAYLYKNNNFVQGLELEFNVGGAPAAVGPAITSVTTLGRRVENLAALQPRDVLLIIKPRGEAFELTLVDQVVTEARLALSPFQLSGIVARARQALLDVVYLAKDPSGVNVFRGRRPPANVTLSFQAGIDIPAEVTAAALRRLAEEGALLYRDLFFSPAAGLEARQIGERLRLLAQRAPLKLQIVSQNFFLPWGLLYLGDDLDQPDAENFLGMRHMIEHIPLQASPPVFEPEIPSRPALAVSLNVDTSIDQAMGREFVGQQVRFWEGVQQSGGIDLTVRQTDQEWLQAMQTPAADQFLYFYGHALTPAENDPAGPDAAALSFTGQKKVSLRDLRLRDLNNRPFPGQPLVFINACESAELSPLFYGGFMPYFTAKGARGMIGTECEVPAVFAAEWAQRFFERFLYREQSVGRIFLDLRREFYFQHQNLLGLLYALYCDGDTRVSPPLTR